MKLLKWIRSKLGYTYLMNKRTHEIHDTLRPHKNCRSHMIARKNRKWLTLNGVRYECTVNGANGCRWCLQDLDTD